MQKLTFLFLSALMAITLSACGETSPVIMPFATTDVIVGTGRDAQPGNSVVVHYTGWLYDATRADRRGAQFDSSRTAGQPFQFVLGAGQVISGWDQGVQGMKVGGQRRLVIPASLAYGDSGAGGVIPPGATLLFDVELLEVELSST